MSNTKWKTLINGIAALYPDGVVYTYKTIYTAEEDHIPSYNHCHCADDQFFAEPLLYKEVEWIEFPSEYECLVNANNRKAGLEIRYQAINPIRLNIHTFGCFDLEDFGYAIRIYAYR